MTQKAFRSSSPQLVPFGEGHLDGAVALSRAAGWPHRRDDWAMLLALSRGRAAVQDGRVVGTALRSDFGGQLSTINMVIVDAALRGQGLGRKITRAAIGEAGQTLRLVATALGQPLYDKLGFETVGMIAMLQGTARNVGRVAQVRSARAEDLSAITALESASFGGDRHRLVDWFWRNANLAVFERGGNVTGFAVARRFGDGHVIGPVVAQTSGEGLALVSHLLVPLDGQRVRLDITEKSGLAPGLEPMGLAVQYTAPVMQRGAGGNAPERRAFASQALG